MSFLDDLAAKLVFDGVGTLGSGLNSPPYTIFMGSKANIPSGDGPYLTIVETGGLAPTFKQNRSGAATRRPSAQLHVRATNYQSAKSMADAAYVSLNGLFNLEINGVQYLSIVARQEPTDPGADEIGRAQLKFNVDTEQQGETPSPAWIDGDWI